MVRVNEVPIHGTMGISLRDDETQQLDRNIKVKLSQGENLISVSVFNQKGATILEYCFLALLILVVLLAGVSRVGVETEKNFHQSEFNEAFTGAICRIFTVRMYH